MKKIHNIPLLVLVIGAALVATICYLTGLTPRLASQINIGGVTLSKSIAQLAKDALFAPLSPLMYALIIMSIGSSLAISRGGLGAKFIRVFAFMITFSVIGGIVAIIGFTVFSDLAVLPLPEAGKTSDAEIVTTPYALKIYGVLTSPLMISIYAGIVFGKALKRLNLGEQADQISDLFMSGFRKFLQYTIPLAVFGSITIALKDPEGVATLGNLTKLLWVYMLTFSIVWVIMVITTSIVLKKPIPFVLRAICPQALVAISTSSSIATLPATKIACDQLGANGDESTPFFTIGATINMVGTLMGLTLLSLYTINTYFVGTTGEGIALGDKIIVALQSLIYSVSAAGVPSASVVLLKDILTSNGVSVVYAESIVLLIITIDTLALDRIRTMLNTQSDSMSTVNGLHVYYKKPAILSNDT